MIRFSALTVAAIALGGIMIHWASSSAFGQHQVSASHVNDSPQVRDSGCQTEVAGRIIRLQPGQGIETGGGWRNCQTYDGHSLIVYTSKPPKSSALETDG